MAVVLILGAVKALKEAEKSEGIILTVTATTIQNKIRSGSIIIKTPNLETKTATKNIRTTTIIDPT